MLKQRTSSILHPRRTTRKTIMDSLTLTGLYCVREGKEGKEGVEKLVRTMVSEGVLEQCNRIDNRVFYKKTNKKTGTVKLYSRPRLSINGIDIPVEGAVVTIGSDPGIKQNNPPEVKEEDLTQEWTRTKVALAINAGKISYDKAGKILSKIDESGAECVVY